MLQHGHSDGLPKYRKPLGIDWRQEQPTMHIIFQLVASSPGALEI